MDQATQSRLAQALLQSLIKLREKKGTILIEDLEVILNQLSHSLQQQDDEVNRFMQEEFRKIADHIGATKQEICSLTAQQEPMTENISQASDQLDAVVKMTEEASTKIMDAADKIQDALDQNNEDMCDTISDAVSQIYMSCNFQDITGQRISKVMRTLEYVDEKITLIMQRFAEHEEHHHKSEEELTQEHLKELEDHMPTNRTEEEALGLLDGPALEKDGHISQEDIDALFGN